jgi:iron complex transport system substrate-binding protein
MTTAGFLADARPAGRACRVSALIVAAALCGHAADAWQPSPPRRIVCLVPAVTEMLFAIGAGPQVVGVSSFERYPPEATMLPAVGALIDPDVERILSLRPDLVVAYGSQMDLRTQLGRANIPILVYAHAGLADVTETLREIGTRVGRPADAGRLATDIERRIAAVRARTAKQPRPRTLVVFGREALALRGVYASGGIGFVHDIVEAAGGTNVFGDVKRQAVQATTEQILARRPEVILELRADPLSPDLLARERGVWNALESVPAVKARRVHIISDPRTVIPGPRVAEAVELLAEVLARRSSLQERPPSEAKAASPTSLRQGYGGPPKRFARRRKGARERNERKSARGWGPARTE